jgi:GxxExxY protein
MSESKIKKLADTISEMAFEAHKYFKIGFLVKFYGNSLRKLGLKVEQQIAVPVIDEGGSVVGDYLADLIIEDSIILELKAVKTITDEHTAHVLAYLRATEVCHGMLINFGSQKLQIRNFIQ